MPADSPPSRHTFAPAPERQRATIDPALAALSDRVVGPTYARVCAATPELRAS